jgi:hypothetical protein
MRAYDPVRNPERPRATPFATVPLAIASGLTLLAVVVGVVAVLVSVDYRGPAPWPEAARLLYFSGIVLLVNGIWCALSRDAARRIWGAQGRGVGIVVATVGLAMLGGALDYDDPSSPWLLLLIPLGVSFMALGVALHGRPATDRSEPLPVALVLVFVVVGLVPVALGILDVA